MNLFANIMFLTIFKLLNNTRGVLHAAVDSYVFLYSVGTIIPKGITLIQPFPGLTRKTAGL